MSRFLEKLNPKATIKSVLLRSLLMCAIAAAVWALALIFRFNPIWEPTWLTFVLWMLCAAFVGAVWEWQVPDEQDD